MHEIEQSRTFLFQKMMLRRKIEKILLTSVLFLSLSITSTFTNVLLLAIAQDTSTSDQLLTYNN